MTKRTVRWMGLVLLAAASSLLQAAPAAHGAVELRVDNLKTPLGIDDPTPSLSWQLNDGTPGARQTAYRIEVALQLESQGSKAKVWDSGRVASGESLNVKYGGPALNASTRYFWRVTVWDANGKPYPTSAPAWWETGLLHADGWRAAWVGYETAEEDAVRHAPAVWIANPDGAALRAEKADEQAFAFRKTVTLKKPVRQGNALCNWAGDGLCLDQRDEVAGRGASAALQAVAVEEVCPGGCNRKTAAPARTRWRLKQCITWLTRMGWRLKLRRL